MSNSVELKTISLCHNIVHAAIRNNLDDIALFMRNESIINKAAFSEVTDKARLSEDDRAAMMLRKWENKVEEDTDCYHKVVREYFGNQPDHFNAVLRKLNDEYTKLCETRGETAKPSSQFSSKFSDKKLAKWLKQFHDLSDQACEILEREGITGSVFLELTEEDMKTVGFNFGTRKILLNVLEKIKTKLPRPVVVEENASIRAATYSTRTELKDHHYARIIDQLIPVKSKWEPIATQLGFKPHEIEDIKGNLSRAHTNDYIYDVITRWMNWGPPDKRGSKDIATLEALQTALDDTNNARIRLTL